MPLGGPGIGDMGVTGRSGVVALLLHCGKSVTDFKSISAIYSCKCSLTLSACRLNFDALRNHSIAQFTRVCSATQILAMSLVDIIWSIADSAALCSVFVAETECQHYP